MAAQSLGFLPKYAIAMVDEVAAIIPIPPTCAFAVTNYQLVRPVRVTARSSPQNF